MCGALETAETKGQSCSSSSGHSRAGVNPYRPLDVRSTCPYLEMGGVRGGCVYPPLSVRKNKMAAARLTKQKSTEQHVDRRGNEDVHEDRVDGADADVSAGLNGIMVN